MTNDKTEKGFLLIGTYTEDELGKGSKGIYVYECNYIHGTFDYRGVATATNPSYITPDDKQRHLYAVCEHGDNSGVSGFSFDPATGNLNDLATTPCSGNDPCNIIVTPDGCHLITANYSSGSLSVFPLDENGTPGPEAQTIKYHGSGPVSERQEASHIHCARFCRCGRWLFVTDLGADSLYRYEVDPAGKNYIIEESKKVFRVKAGSGPRHFVFSDDGRFMYLMNELSASVMVFSYEHGEIQQIQHLPPIHTGGDGGDIKISPDGRHVYASTRQTDNDGIAIYRRDPEKGFLDYVGYQPCVLHPRNIEFTPGGRFLFVAGMKARKVQVLAYNPETGRLSDTGRSIDVTAPTCLVFTR